MYAPQCPFHIGYGVAVLLLSGLVQKMENTSGFPLGNVETLPGF